LFPVKITSFTFKIITWSPVSILGVNVGLCFPLNNLAASVATLPSGLFAASIMYHLLSISAFFWAICCIIHGNNYPPIFIFLFYIYEI